MFIKVCILCHALCPKNITLDLCPDCHTDLPWCSEKSDAPIHTILTNHTFITLFNYTFPVDHWITQLKFHHNFIYARLLGELLTTKIRNIYQQAQYTLPELILPVPLHKKRLQERGFNQALEISKIVSRNLNIPLDYTSCIRTKHTQAQSLLSSKDRRTNLKQAFFLAKPVQARHIAVLDDVLTTGQTLQAFIEILSGGNISSPLKIDIWCCALAQLAL